MKSKDRHNFLSLVLYMAINYVFRKIYTQCRFDLNPQIPSMTVRREFGANGRQCFCRESCGFNKTAIFTRSSDN